MPSPLTSCLKCWRCQNPGDFGKAGICDPCDRALDVEVDRWHAGIFHEEGTPLHEFLRLTREQYAAWVELRRPKTDGERAFSIPDLPLAEPQFAPGIEAEIGRVEGRHCVACGHVRHVGACSQCGVEGECAPDPLDHVRRVEDALDTFLEEIESAAAKCRRAIQRRK